MANNFDKILDECIDRINQGESLEVCLADYPEYVGQLEPLLRAMLQIQGAYSFVPSASAKREARQHFNAALERLELRSREKQPLFTRVFARPIAWATVATVLLILVAGFFALKPWLYPIVEAKTGIIEVRVTDAPPEYGITEIWVTVSDSEEGVAVHKAGDDGDGVWITIPITGDNPFELLSLQKADLDALLATEEVTAGKYTQIRMTIDIVQVRIGDGDLQPAVLPSGKLKFVRPFEVFDGETTIILLDFDADKSVTVTGGGKVIVKPVVKLSIQQGKQ
ncbi:MAG TPA: DUF4382 domain-containing protein [Dehalococcoidia bacterium]|jgi:hypothetical protein|nr:DUF4382 domain-containing protein [Dehalococcoidia bacterium]